MVSIRQITHQTQQIKKQILHKATNFLLTHIKKTQKDTNFNEISKWVPQF